MSSQEYTPKFRLIALEPPLTTKETISAERVRNAEARRDGFVQIITALQRHLDHKLRDIMLGTVQKQYAFKKNLRAIYYRKCPDSRHVIFWDDLDNCVFDVPIKQDIGLDYVPMHEFPESCFAAILVPYYTEGGFTVNVEGERMIIML